jgi:phage gp29-like protein
MDLQGLHGPDFREGGNAMNNQPVIVSLEALRTLRQNKYNPLRTLKPDRLASILEAWEIGNLREGAMLFETIADRDDTIKSVKPKREKEVSQLDRQFMALPGSGDAGDKHRQILEDFWTNVRTINAYDRNERGGFRRLVKQMMTSVSYRYAAHHIVWRPSPNGLRATFEFVPLWLFENRTGMLRYLSSPWATEGDLLDPGEWMITHGDGLMIACSIGYLAKRSAFNDWLVFSEKFSVPGVLGRTTAKKGSAEADAMRDAVRSFGHDWTGVIYGDDGTHEKPIEIIQAQGNPSGMPMPAVVERVDRKFAALYRGADLSSMSSGGGEGTGASLQGKEKDILLADDAETINETLAEVSRMVIEWHFGRGTEPLAKVELIVPSDEDEKFYLESVKSVKEMGVRLAKDAVLERLGLQEAAEDEAALGEATSNIERPTPNLEVKEDLANSDLPEDLADRLRAALSSDLQPLGEALAGALQAGDLPALQAALRKISERMPEFLESEAMAELLADEAVSAFLGEAEEVENAGSADGARKGWETRRANGWVPAPRLLTPAEADDALSTGFFISNPAGEKIRFGAELQRKLDEKVINDADRNARKQRLRWAALAVSDGTHESSNRHGNVRTLYSKTFRKGPKHQDVEVIVDTINGYAWNIMVKGGRADAIR